MQSSWVVMGLLFFVLLSSGCILGSDSKGVATELRTLRETYVVEGLLAPTTTKDRSAYRAELLPLRKRILDAGGLDAGTLNDYVDGSLALLEMHESLSQGNAALVKDTSGIFDCTKSGFAGQALAHFQSAKESSQSAHASFQRVLANVNMANELGVTFLQNATSTTESTSLAYGSRIDEIKTTCGLPI
jgi:hypothetical protein